MTTVYCGDAMCKRSFDLTVDASTRWPVNCVGCGAPLYPRDRFPSPGHEDFLPEARVMMVLRGGSLSECKESDLRPAPAPRTASEPRAVQAQRPPMPPTPEAPPIIERAPSTSDREGSPGALIALAILVVLAVVIGLLAR